MVFDSMRKSITEYQNLIDILQKTWAHFIKSHIEVTEKPCDLDIELDFPV
jgi:hypothetical protein